MIYRETAVHSCFTLKIMLTRKQLKFTKKWTLGALIKTLLENVSVRLLIDIRSFS